MAKPWGSVGSWFSMWIEIVCPLTTFRQGQGSVWVLLLLKPWLVIMMLKLVAVGAAAQGASGWRGRVANATATLIIATIRAVTGMAVFLFNYVAWLGASSSIMCC